MQHEKHAAKKDPEQAHRHKIEEEVAAAGAVGTGGYAFHEHHEKKSPYPITMTHTKKLKHLGCFYWGEFYLFSCVGIHTMLILYNAF